MHVLWWAKRDLRLDDNGALREAVAEALGRSIEVLPVWVLEPRVVDAADSGVLHYRMVLSALHGLRDGLRRRGADLLILSGDAPAVFEELMRTVAFDSIHAHEETGTAVTYSRDRAMRAWCRRSGVRLTEHPHGAVVRRLESRDERMALWRERMHRAPVAPPSVIPMSDATLRMARDRPVPALETVRGLRSDGAHGHGWWTGSRAVQRCDEESAARTLDSFLATRCGAYRDSISSPERSRRHGSRLSVHLAWGTISMRRVFHELWRRETELRDRITDDAPASLRQMRASLRSFSSRLYWHDHFCQRLEDEPTMETEALNRAYEAMHYDGNDNLPTLMAGRTGYPLVDAVVRALTETGFVNFRMRAMLVSVACHVLHIDWRVLRDPMARIMADYLPGIHLSQLQMQAGVVGINQLRIYNPTKQLLDNDPDCTFVRRFVPELRTISAERIRAIALASCDTASARASDRALQYELFGGAAGTHGRPEDYPAAVVDYREAIDSTRERLFSIRGTAAARAESRRVLDRHGSRLRGFSRRG